MVLLLELIQIGILKRWSKMQFKDLSEQEQLLANAIELQYLTRKSIKAKEFQTVLKFLTWKYGR